MKYINNQLYTCGGGYRPGGETNRPGTIQILNNDSWNIYDDNISEKQAYLTLI